MFEFRNTQSLAINNLPTHTVRLTLSRALWFDDERVKAKRNMGRLEAKYY